MAGDWFSENAPTAAPVTIPAPAPTSPASATPSVAPTVDWFTQNQPPPPEPSPFEKAGRAFWEGLGMPTMLDLASGDEARAKHALTTLGQGILGELPRAGQSLV